MTHNSVTVDSPAYLETEVLEDVEPPAWVSTTSCSESCGSCFSRLSSWKGNESPEMSETRIVPDQLEKLGLGKRLSLCLVSESCQHPEVSTGGAADLQSPSSEYKGNDTPYTVTGSLQSLASSSKTVYVSPRSNSEKQFHCSLNKALLSEKAKQRRGSLYRERAPSDNALDFSNLRNIRDSKLSHSLHDVSSIPSNGLKNPRKAQNAGTSLSALYSRNRSRDSGFIHSGSLLSLNSGSGSHNYDHVESKVKRYIQNIKEADALRKKERAKSRSLMVDVHIPVEEDFSETQDGPELIDLVHKLQHELEEKDRVLLQLKEDYYNLLKKYAEAENKIDKLRFGWCESGGQENIAQKIDVSRKSVLRQLQEGMKEVDDSSLTSTMFLSHFETADSFDTSSSFKDNGQKNFNQSKRGRKEVVVSAPLRPISSLYCSSVRLDCVMAPLTLNSAKSQADTSSTVPFKSLCAKVKKESPEGTTEKGIDGNCPASSGGSSVKYKSINAQPLGQLPPEDPILKVQRWQNSLSMVSQQGAACPSNLKTTSLINTEISDNNFDVKYYNHEKIVPNSVKPRTFSSIGIQVNENTAPDFPSLSSGLSTPMVPCLNLADLSGFTEDLSVSGVYGECENNKSNNKHVSAQSMICESSSAPENEFSILSKSPTSEFVVPSSAEHKCEDRSKGSGCYTRCVKKLPMSGSGDVENSKDLLGKECHTTRKPQLLLGLSNQASQKLASNLNGTDLANLISLVWRDQDHVVPASPGEEKSFQDAFKTLERKISALKSSVNLQTFVSLLDVLMEKVFLKECLCQNEHINPSDIRATEEAHGHPDLNDVDPLESDRDYSLLQCLEEVDDYTHQVWVKTQSFLDVLNSSNCEASSKAK